MKARGRRSTARGHLRAALLCLALLGAALPCAGASRLEASLGFGGYAPPGRWVPLWIRGEALPRDASIQVLRLSAEGVRLGLETYPALEGIRLECPAWTGGDLDALSIRLMSEDRALAEVRLDARARPFPGHLVLACGLSPQARLAIGSALMPVEPVLAIAALPSDLPSNGLDYDAVSAIAISGGKVELSPGQRGALLAWMAGGGRLCVAEPAGGQGSLQALGLEGRAGGGPVPYGLGSFVSLAPDRAEAPAAWREALALEPYDPSLREGAGSVARSSATAGRAGGATGETRAIIAAAIAAWLAATLLAAALGRGRAAPFASVAALCLAAVLAGGPALDRALARGADIQARALVLPGSGAAFLSLRADAYTPPSSLEWAAVSVLGKPSIAYSDEESGSFGEWRHSLPKAVFGLRRGEADGLDLEGMLGPGEWEELTAGSTSALAPRGGKSIRGETEPPGIESSSPLAFLAPGEPASWWTKAPGGPWAKSEAPPEWLGGDALWLASLRGGKRALAVLAGYCATDSLALGIEGGPLREIRWAMPLPKGGLE
jgi:hypothetical protein